MRHYLTLFLLIALPAVAQVAGPYTKIHPGDGRVVGGAERPGTFLEESELTLSAFPGETLCFQWLLPGGKSWQISASAEQGGKPSLFQVGLVADPDIPGKTWPDVLLPLQAPPGAPVTTREGAPLFPRENRYQIIWVDIPVGEGPAAPTTLLATRDGVQKSLVVHIAVSKGKLAPPPLLIDLNEYGDKYLRHLPGDVDRDGRLAAEQAIY
ncbi:MAG TPA: hypothetical protein PKV71_18490, partial [Calditrichia bacterium]|nr:hypothetical protein [Calditrichia bacterium]